MKYILFFAYIFIILISCKKEVDISTRDVEVKPFNHIKLEDAFELYLSEGPAYSVRLEGDGKVIEKVNFTVEKDTLFIADNRSFKWTTPRKNKIKVFITSPPLKRVQANGGNTIRTLTPITSEEFGLILSGKSCEAEIDLDVNTFYFWNNFSTGGKLTLRGNTNVLKIWNVALMSVDAGKLNSKTAIIENDSKGDCIVKVNNKLEYKITGTGNIQLYGNPTQLIELEASSTGQLISH